MRKSGFSGVLGTNLGNNTVKSVGYNKWPVIASLALLAGLAACKTTEPVVAVYDTTITQPDMTPLETRAAAYVQFRSDVELLEATVVDSAKATRDAHNRLASHNPATLSSGWVAYGALVAADNAEFAASVQEQMQISGGREAFLNDMRKDPSVVLTFRGANAAFEDVLRVTAVDAYKYKALGDAYISEAYALQKVSWAKAKISDGTSRVSSARDYSYSRPGMATPYLPASMASGVIQPGLSSSDRIWSPSWAGSSNYASRDPQATPIMARVLVLAAQYSVGDLDDNDVSNYARNDRSSKCLNMAKLNLDQCIAATRTPYEEMFCLGTHGLNDVSGCLGWVAGVSG